MKCLACDRSLTIFDCGRCQEHGDVERQVEALRSKVKIFETALRKIAKGNFDCESVGCPAVNIAELALELGK